jgi:hypothetical protein
MFPIVTEAREDGRAPYHIVIALNNDYWNNKYSTLRGLKGIMGYDYFLCPLPHLEKGLLLKDWLPEIPIDYNLKINIPKSAYPDRTLLYFSGVDANQGFHSYSWKPPQWKEVVRLLNEKGIRPTIVGANTASDITYFSQVGLVGDFENLLGKTSIPEYAAIINECKSWTGLNSGGGILSAYLKRKTNMLWSDKKYGGILPTEQQHSWLEDYTNYRTLSYKSPDMTPEKIVELICT